MNRMIYILACLCLLISCQEQRLEDVSQKGRTVIDCDIESLLFDGSERLWPEGAMVGVYGSKKGQNTPFYLKNADSNLTRGEFYGQDVCGDKVSAYYPYCPTYSAYVDAYPVLLSPMQDYTEADPATIFLNYCPKAFAFMSDESLRFEYPFGMLCLKVELEEVVTVNKVVVKAQQPVAGAGKVYSEGLKMDESANLSATLDCKNTLSRDADGNAAEFYMVITPGQYQGLKVEFYVDGDATPLLCTVNEAEIPRIGAENFALLSVIVKYNGPEGFVGENVEFDVEEE